MQHITSVFVKYESFIYLQIFLALVQFFSFIMVFVHQRDKQQISRPVTKNQNIEKRTEKCKEI